VEEQLFLLTLQVLLNLTVEAFALLQSSFSPLPHPTLQKLRDNCQALSYILDYFVCFGLGGFVFCDRVSGYSPVCP
jgi:hypothetical protein